MGLIQAIELYPNLEVLKMPAEGCPEDQIASTIKECCLGPRTIKCHTGNLEDRQEVPLVLAPRRLSSVSGDVSGFTTQTGDILL